MYHPGIEQRNKISIGDIDNIDEIDDIDELSHDDRALNRTSSKIHFRVTSQIMEINIRKDLIDTKQKYIHKYYIGVVLFSNYE